MFENTVGDRIWILGAGRAGRFALRALGSLDVPPHFTVVDPDEGALGRARRLLLRKPGESGYDLVAGDAVAYLAENLRSGPGPDWIVPAVPIHVAAEWLLRELGPRRARNVAVPEAVTELVPGAARGTGGDSYASRAIGRCPAACPEPPGHCPATGRPRGEDLFTLLERLDVGDCVPLVVRSHQLSPGVGGYRPAALLELLRRLKEIPIPRTVLVITACRCHAVITALEISRLRFVPR